MRCFENQFSFHRIFLRAQFFFHVWRFLRSSGSTSTVESDCLAKCALSSDPDKTSTRIESVIIQAKQHRIKFPFNQATDDAARSFFCLLSCCYLLFILFFFLFFFSRPFAWLVNVSSLFVCDDDDMSVSATVLSWIESMYVLELTPDWWMQRNIQNDLCVHVIKDHCNFNDFEYKHIVERARTAHY